MIKKEISLYFEVRCTQDENDESINNFVHGKEDKLDDFDVIHLESVRPAKPESYDQARDCLEGGMTLFKSYQDGNMELDLNNLDDTALKAQPDTKKNTAREEGLDAYYNQLFKAFPAILGET